MGSPAISPSSGSPPISSPAIPTSGSSDSTAPDPFGAVLGPTLPPTSSAPNGVPWSLADYPRPPGDTGRGFDWIPTLHSSPDVVDRFVKDAQQMGASWVVILNDGTQVGDNDYLVKQLAAHNIEPIMRIYTPQGQPIGGDLEGMVRHYVGLGVHYFQPYNESNLPEENPNGQVSVSGYLDRWIPAARAILAGGGLPGIGALAPGAPNDDVAFLRSAFQGLKQRGAADLLDQGWISMHNYSFNRPVSYQDDSNGFLKFRWYDQVAEQELGRSLPVIGTEGGPRLGDHQDPRYPAVDPARRDALVQGEFHYLDQREPYFFAQTQWLIANEAGGGHDPSWRADALYGPDGAPTALVGELQASGEENA